MKKQAGYLLKRKAAPYVMLSPFYLMFVCFWVIPLVMAFWMSLTEWKFFEPPTIVGFRNYALLFKNTLFRISINNTLLLWIIYLVALLVLSLSISLILDSYPLRGKKFFRLTYFIPITISMVVVAMIFEHLFAERFGLLNSIFDSLGLQQVPWMSEPFFARIMIMILRLWRAVGYYTVIIFAGLRGIAEELYESADIDGASPLKQIFYIKIPLLRPVILFVLIAATIKALQLFTEPWIMTGGGPARSTTTLGIFIYRTSFLQGNLDIGATVGFLLGIITITITLVKLFLIGRES